MALWGSPPLIKCCPTFQPSFSTRIAVDKKTGLADLYDCEGQLECVIHCVIFEKDNA